MFYPRPALRLGLKCLVLTLYLFTELAQARSQSYDLNYKVTLQAGEEHAAVSIELCGQQLPSQLVLHIEAERHRGFEGDGQINRSDNTVTWKPEGDCPALHYRFTVSARKDSGSYDSLLTREWAILRSDKLIPPIASSAPKTLTSNATLRFKLPEGWSSAAPYEALDSASNDYQLHDSERRFVRPKGWLILGNIATRQDMIAGTSVRIAAPSGQGRRLQDILAFISWTLPHIKPMLAEFPTRLLVVSAGDPMWRGGLSAPNSLFMHSERPLISGNRTSSLIHELIHVGTSIHGTQRSDWIVEGLAEYYALAILYRSGAISQQRFEQSLEELAEWGKQSPGLFTGDSEGSTTARAVGVMHALDRELRDGSDGEKSLDDIVAALSREGGTVSVEDFIECAETLSGHSLSSLEAVKTALD